MKISLEVEGFSLDNTLRPSFISSLYQRVEPLRWVKIAGYLGGQLELRQSRPGLLEVRCEARLTEKALRRRVLFEAGLWRGPYEELIKGLPEAMKPQVEALARVYPGVRVPIAPLDFTYILVAVGLSKRADYDRSVLGWCHGVWERFDGDIYEIASCSADKLREVGTSYQILQLPDIVRSFIELPKNLPERVSELFGVPHVPAEEFILLLSPELARLSLIHGCWGLGPKMADSIVLSTFKATHFIPCDVHLRSVAQRLNLVDVEGAKMPSKRLCSLYVCDEETSRQFDIPLCPLSKSGGCIRARFAPLGLLGGWLQTLTYLHGRAYCRTLAPRCGECPLKRVCSGP